MSTPQSQTALAAQPKPTLTQELASHYGIEGAKFIATLKATVMPKRQGGEPVAVSDEELAAFCMVAKEYGLNPFLKEIHAFPNKSGGVTPIVGVDGWAKLMNRQPNFDGIEFEAFDDDNGKPVSVTAHIYVKGRSRPVSVTEYYSECQRGTEPWRQMPRRMLRHKALIQGARVAFGFCGIHDEDEAADIAESLPKAPRNVTPKAPLFAAPKVAPTVPAPEPAPAEQPAELPLETEADNAGVASPDPIRQRDMQAVEEVKAANYAKIAATELDQKRDRVEKAFIASGMGFDDLKAFLASRTMDTDAGTFAELEEVAANKLTTSEQALTSFVRQAKRLKDGGAQ